MSLLFEFSPKIKVGFLAVVFRLQIKFKVLLRMSESETSEVPESAEKESEKDSIIDRVTKLFGVEVAQKFQGKLKKKLAESLRSLSSPV